MSSELHKILIAARGEIALRIIRTVRSMGLATIGIYSENDKDSTWIRQCDESFSLGNGSLNDTYLNINKIIDIAVKAGADAVHPGYGFLSENSMFALACAENQIVFIGPSVDVLELMGNKPKAHEYVKNLGFPVPERYTGTVNDLRDLNERLHYPVMVKAASGGGGKGMRLVTGKAMLNEALKLASSEAGQFFANKEIYIEQYLNDVKHIEIQILGDHHGNIVHLFERECSVQRRNQKLIEESPSTITPRLRKQLTDAAITIASSVNFYSAGTIEFLVRDDQYWFLEVNPRIQVEHGVTEMITGTDIVKEQILIAQNQPLSVSQSGITMKGHSMEARIYAEDPENFLLPSPGTIIHFIPPEANGHLRIETGAEDMQPVLAEFDPLIAKLIVHGNDRSDAIQQMNEALNRFVITGIRQNLPLLSAILCDQLFISRHITTTYLENSMERLMAVISDKKQADFRPASLAAAIFLLNNKFQHEQATPWQCGFWRNVRQIRLYYGNDIVELDYHSQNGKMEFQADEEVFKASDSNVTDQQISFTFEGRRFLFFAFEDEPSSIEISDGRLSFLFARFSDKPEAVYESEEDFFAHTADMITAPQPGTVMEIKVAEGQLVKRGDYLLTIESMKLENTIMADKHGYIKKIAIKAGDKVKKNEPLIYLQDTINN